MQQQKILTRNTYMDVIRILAAFGVIYIHSGDMGYNLYASTENIVLRFIYYLFAVMTEISVPLFFMVSGALLLKKDEAITDIIKNRCLRIVVVLLVASLCHYVYNSWVGIGDQVTIAGYLKGLLNNGFTGSLWFLYAYLMYLLILPFLRMLVRQMTSGQYIYLFVLCLIFKGVTEVLLQWSGSTLEIDIYESPVFDKIFIYPMMGYYIENVVGDNYDKKKYVVGNLLIAIVTSLFVTWMSMNRNMARGEFTVYDKGLFKSMLTAAIAVAVYALVRHVVCEMKISERMQRFLKVLGTNTFGVYLLERFVRENILFVYFSTEKYVTRIGAALILVLFTFIICEGITVILKKIPIVKKFI